MRCYIITLNNRLHFLLISLQLVEVPSVPVSTVVDATGAGDAFLGGLVSGICPNPWLKLPFRLLSSQIDLHWNIVR